MLSFALDMGLSHKKALKMRGLCGSQGARFGHGFPSKSHGGPSTLTGKPPRFVWRCYLKHSFAAANTGLAC